jgi:peptide/nickel transport system permease protein
MQEEYGSSYNQGPDPLVIANYMKKLGLDKDIFTQYINYITNVIFHFDLGPSMLAYPRPAQDLIADRIVWSVGLLSISIIISWIIGVVTGTLVGWKRGTKLDSVIFTTSLVMSQIPNYLVGIFLVLFIGYGLRLLPTQGAYDAGLVKGLNMPFILSLLSHAFLPAMSFILISTFGRILLARSVTVSILGEDYLLLAQAKGLKKIRILNRYVLRNSLLPNVTSLAMSLGFAVNGFYLIEWIYRYPGIGSLLQLAIAQLDFNVIQGIILVSITTVLTANLIMDILYPFIDPRIKIGNE